MRKLLLLISFILPLFVAGHNITSTTTGGAWSTTSTWVGGVVPGTNDTATIATTSGHSVTIGGVTVLKVTVNSGAILTVSTGGSFFVNGLFTNSGSVTGTGFIILKGSGTVLTGNGDWSGHQNNLSFAGSNQVIDASVSLVKSVGEIVMNTVNAGGKVKVTNNGSVTLTDAVNGGILNNGGSPSTWINAANSYLQVAIYSWKQSTDTLYASATGNTVVYAGSSAILMKTPVSKTYYHLTIANSNYVSLNSSLNANSLVVNSGCHLNMSADTLFLSGSWTNSGTILNHQPNLIDTAVIKLSGTIVDKIPASWYAITSTATGGYWTTWNSWTSGLIPYVYDTAIIATTSCNNVVVNTSTVAKVTVNSGGKLSVVTGTLTVNGLLTNNGIVNGNGCSIIFHGTGTVLTGAGTWAAACSFGGYQGNLVFNNNPQTIDASVNFTPQSNGTIVLNNTSGAVKVINNGTILLADATYGHIIDQSGGTHSTTWVNGANSYLQVSGNSFTNSFDTLYASATGNTILYAGTSAYTIKKPVSSTYYNLSVNTTNTISIGANITVSNNLSVAAGTFNCQNFQITGTSTGTLSLASGTSLLLGLTSSSTSVSFPTNYTSISLAATSTVTYQANTSQTISTNPSSYGNLVLSTAGSKTPASSPLNIAGNLTINSGTTLPEGTGTINLTGNLTNGGTLTLSSGAFNIGGNFTNNGTFTYSTSTITFNGSSGQTIGGTSYPTFYNLTISGTSGETVNLGGNQTVSHNLNITSCTLDATTSNYNLTVAGNFTNSGGTFNPRSNTVTMNGSTQTLGGSALINLNKLVISSGATTLGGNITTTSDITISGTLNASSYTITTAGNFIDNGTFNKGTSTVYFNKNGHQCISGSSVPTFNNVTVGSLSTLAAPGSIHINGAVIVLPGGLMACAC